MDIIKNLMADKYVFWIDICCLEKHGNLLAETQSLRRWTGVFRQGFKQRRKIPNATEGFRPFFVTIPEY
jgi:hypothetical protein